MSSAETQLFRPCYYIINVLISPLAVVTNPNLLASIPLNSNITWYENLPLEEFLAVKTGDLCEMWIVRMLLIYVQLYLFEKPGFIKVEL